jgi:hypothetical protein
MNLRCTLLLLGVLLVVSACGSLTERQSTLLGGEYVSPFAEIQPGLSDFDTITDEDRDEAKWWDRFYGRGGSGGAGGAASGTTSYMGGDSSSTGTHGSGSHSTSSDSAQ